MADEKKEVPTTTSNQNPKEEKKKEMVEVEKSVLQGILDKQKIQDETAANQAKEIEKLTAVADLKRLSQWDLDHQTELIRTAKVATLNHKGKERIVLGWKSIKDYVHFENGVHKFEQTAEYYLEGDDPENPITIEMDQRNWYQEIGRLDGEIIKETSTPDGKSTRVLRFPDGREIEFDSVFINP